MGKHQKKPERFSQEEKFLEELERTGHVRKAAIAARPELTPAGAETWGRRVLKDPEIRRQMHNIEQGGLYRMRLLLDKAIDVIDEILSDDSPKASKKLKLDAANLLAKRIYGAVPEAVTLVKFSLFDGEGKRSDLRKMIQNRVEESINEEEHGDQ